MGLPTNKKLAAERRALSQTVVPRKQSISKCCLFKHSGPQRYSLRKCRHKSYVDNSNTNRNTGLEKDQYVEHMKCNLKELGDADSLISSSTDKQSVQVQENIDMSDDAQNASASATLLSQSTFKIDKVIKICLKKETMSSIQHLKDSLANSASGDVSSSQGIPKVKENFKQSNERKQKTQKRKISSDNQERTSEKTKVGAEEDMQFMGTCFKKRKGNGAEKKRVSVENDITSYHNKDNALLKDKHSGKLNKKMIAGGKIMNRNSTEETAGTAVQGGISEAISQDKYQMKRVLRSNSKQAKSISKHSILREESDSDTATHFLKCDQQSSIPPEKEIVHAQNMSTECVQRISEDPKRMFQKKIMADHVNVDSGKSRQHKSKSMYRSWYSKRRYRGKRQKTTTLWDKHARNRKSTDDNSLSQALESDTPMDSTTSKTKKYDGNIGNPVKDRQIVSHIPPLRTTTPKHSSLKIDMAEVANSEESSKLVNEASEVENVDATAKLQSPSQKLQVWEQSLRPALPKIKQFQAGPKPAGSQKGGKKKNRDVAVPILIRNGKTSDWGPKEYLLDLTEKKRPTKKEKTQPMQSPGKMKQKPVGPPIPEGLQTPSQNLRGWKQSLRPTPPKIERFQAGQTTKLEGSQKGGKKKHKNVAEEKIEPMQSPEKLKQKPVGPPIPEGKYTVGILVWGKLKGLTWWPACIIHHYEAGKTEMPSPDLRWVRWFGDKKLSLLAGDKLSPFQQFETHFNEKYYRRVALYRKAIFEVTKLAAKRSEIHLQSAVPERAERGETLKTDEDKAAYMAVCEELIEWAREGFTSDRPESIEPSPEEVKPPRPPSPVCCPPSPKPSTSSSGKAKNKNSGYEDRRGQHLENLRKGELKMEDMCIGCGELEIAAEHPLFEGGLCAECKVMFIEVAYLFDTDGYQSYCSICAEGTDYVLCGETTCGRSFCVDCLDLLVAPEESKKVINQDPWCCYMCKPDTKQGFLVRRSDWSKRLLSFFQDDAEINFQPLCMYPAVNTSDRKSIRVLSLSDGIGTALLVLKELGFNVECYYASEISKDAIKVASVRHKRFIQHIGDVMTINKCKLDSLGQIDLLIGGSPSNNLSTVNPARKDLYGKSNTSLFYDFYRLLQHIRHSADDTRPFFWLFENMVFMAHCEKMNVSRLLECNPVLINAKDFIPAHRARYFWGNLPGMNRPRIAAAESTLELQDVLERNCNRQAQCTEMRTITPKSNSVQKRKNQFLPVKMDGEEDILWCTEMERVFGFPEHYTDVANLKCANRQQLLGKAWCVPVIKHLLAPLKDYFVTETQ